MPYSAEQDTKQPNFSVRFPRTLILCEHSFWSHDALSNITIYFKNLVELNCRNLVRWTNKETQKHENISVPIAIPNVREIATKSKL